MIKISKYLINLLDLIEFCVKEFRKHSGLYLETISYSKWRIICHKSLWKNENEYRWGWAQYRDAFTLHC